MTFDLDSVQTSKPEKVAANTFQAYQASVSDAWDIEVSFSGFLSAWYQVVGVELGLEVAVLKVEEAAANSKYFPLFCFLIP